MNAVTPISAVREPLGLEPSSAALPTSSRKGQRHLARSCSPRVSREDVAEQLAALANMERNDLIVEWRKLFRSNPPDRIRRELLELGIAWRIQEKAFGGLKKAIASELRRLSEDLNETGDIRKTERPLLKPGTRLLREWGGETYEVTVLNDGFLWKDKTWKSLSAIAETITGAHWSGPRFFGLKKRSSSSPAQEVVADTDIVQLSAVAPGETAATAVEEELADA